MSRQPAIVVAVLLMLVSTACGGGDEGDGFAGATCDLTTALDAAGQLTVATGENVSPPWIEDGDPTNGLGFESALVYAIADELGLDTVEWAVTTPEDAIAAGDKSFDFAIQQHLITEDAGESVEFSISYYQVEQSIIGSPDSEIASATSLSNLRDSQLGAMSRTNGLAYIESEIGPDKDPFVFDDEAAAAAAFEAGQVDGIVVDLPTAYVMTTVDIPDAAVLAVLPRVDEEPDQFGIVFESASPLVACVDEALGTLRDEGVLDELEEEWLNDRGSIPSISL